jgi:hypothetical protein
MRTVKTKHEIRWMPPLKALQESGHNQHGWLIIDRLTWEITNIHSFDDFGSTVETLTIERNGLVKVIFSHDECETFTFNID